MHGLEAGIVVDVQVRPPEAQVDKLAIKREVITSPPRPMEVIVIIRPVPVGPGPVRAAGRVAVEKVDGAGCAHAPGRVTAASRGPLRERHILDPKVGPLIAVETAGLVVRPRAKA